MPIDRRARKLEIPSSAQVAAACVIACEIVDHAASKYRLPSGELADGKLGANVNIHVQPVMENWGCLKKLRATSGITVHVPIGSVAIPGYRKFDKDMKRVICGILLHELTHILQQKADLGSFAQVLADQKALGDPQTAVEYLEYYSAPLEIEAHAVQAAGELYYTDGGGLPHADVLAKLPSTHVHSRIAMRLGSGHLWFTGFEDAVWKAYSSW